MSDEKSRQIREFYPRLDGVSRMIPALCSFLLIRYERWRDVKSRPALGSLSMNWQTWAHLAVLYGTKTYKRPAALLIAQAGRG
ncbi:hypothetical protein [Bradyrhizobium sp. USDA 4451]